MQVSDTNIHVIGLRDGRGDTFLGEGWRFDSINQLFTEAHRNELVAKIPEQERFNIYFTAAKCWPGSGRKFASQDCIPFDIDKLYIPDGATDSEAHAIAMKASEVACEVLGVSLSQVGIIFSGNGVWVWVQSTQEWTDEEYFKKTRIYYEDICKRITQKLKERGIVGTADTTGWGRAKLCRMPDTLNVKPGKPRRMARVLQAGLQPLPWTIQEACPDLKHFEEAETAAHMPTNNPDVAGILRECAFLAERITDHATEPELEWYARAGLYAFFPNGKDQLFHEHSKQYHGYDRYQTECKLEQAREAQKGPRLCKGIAAITANKYCLKCKHYQKVTTPFMITSENFIKTETTGFWNMTAEGKPSKPHYQDLIKAFIKEFTYISILKEEVIMKFNGTHWEEMPDQLIKAWVNDKTNPKYNEQQRESFVKELHVQTGRIKNREDFDLGAFGKMNFKNCVLDMTTMKTDQHSPNYLFTYCLPYSYDPSATSPVFEKFVNQVTSCAEDALTIKEFIGYAASGDDVTGKGRCLLLIGGGSNGKGVLTRLTRTIVGEKNASGKPMEMLTNRPFTRHEIMYKLINISDESTENVFKYTEYLKTMTNGDTVTAEKKHGPETDYKNRTKLMMSMNQTPKIYDDSTGFARRLLVIPFEKTFEGTSEDPRLEYNLRQEIPGVLNSCIKAYVEMKKRGEETHTTLPFSSCLLSLQRITKIKDDDDYFKMFADERIFLEVNAQETGSTFYSAYLNFCNDVGLRQRLSPIKFALRLKKHFNLEAPRLSNGKKFYTGIKLHQEF